MLHFVPAAFHVLAGRCHCSTWRSASWVAPWWTHCQLQNGCIAEASVHPRFQYLVCLAIESFIDHVNKHLDFSKVQSLHKYYNGKRVNCGPVISKWRTTNNNCLSRLIKTDYMLPFSCNLATICQWSGCYYRYLSLCGDQQARVGVSRSRSDIQLENMIDWWSYIIDPWFCAYIFWSLFMLID